MSKIAIEQAGILLRIRSMYPSFRPSEKKVADYVLAHPEEVINLPVTELGKRTGTSEAAVVRFSQAAGLQGYWALKIAIAQDMAAGAEELEKGASKGSPEALRAQVFSDSIQALRDTNTVLDMAQVEMAVDAICTSSRILFMGVGASGLVASDAQHKFARIGLNAMNHLDSHIQSAIAGTLGPDDFAVFVSHSGDTNVVVDCLKIAHDGGARTACITNYLGSRVTQIADIVLLTASEQTIFRTSSMSSRIAQLAVIDVLYSLTMARKGTTYQDSLEKARAAIALLES